MKPNSRILALIGISVLAPLLARADFITLKSGEKIEGKIISENADSMQVEYHLTPKIKDTKTILKASIAEVVKQTPAELEFHERELGKLLPTRDLMTAPEYEAAIQDKLRIFIAKYPDTPEAQEAEKMIAELANEKSKVLSGEVRMEGKWLDAATVKRDAYNIGAYRLRQQMGADAASHDELRYLHAMRDFEKLRTDFGASPHYVLAVPEALAILKKFETQLKGMIVEAPIVQQKRQNGLKSLSGSDQIKTTEAIAKEEANFKAAIDRQTKDKERWMEISKYDVKSLQDALATVEKDRSELQAIDLAALQLENETMMSVIRSIADGNLADAKVVFEKISKMPGLINKTLVQDLTKRIEDLDKTTQLEEKKAAKAAATATPATEATNESLATNPVAEEMKRVQESKDNEVLEKSKKDAAAAAAKAEAPKPPSQPVEEPTGIMDTLKDKAPLLLGGVLVVVGVIWFMKKRKKAQ